jgi:hypothetical protein
MSEQANPMYNFLQAANFGKGLTYSKGLHRVAPGVSDNPYFQKLLKAGLVVQANVASGDPAALTPTSLVEKQKKAIESAKAQAAAKVKPAEKAAPASKGSGKASKAASK